MDILDRFDNLRRFSRRGIQPIPKPRIATHGTNVDTAKEILEEGTLKPSPELNFSFSGTWSEDVMFIFNYDVVKDLTLPHLYLLYSGLTGVRPYEFVPRYAVNNWTWIVAGAEITTFENTIPVNKARSVSLAPQASQLKPTFEKKGINIGGIPDTPLGQWLQDTKVLIKDYFDNPGDSFAPDKPPNRRLARMVMAYNKMVAGIYGLDMDKVLTEVKRSAKGQPWW